VLRKYETQYGDRTVNEIRALYAIQQMEECLAKNDPDTALSVLALLSRAYNTLPPTSPLREEAKALWDKAMYTWH
jgi:predicted ATP-grasp superfamily ATP-dependent carboligase